ncbi:unnamed protein product [Oikopleura dioica]|uniref:Uncharacterized protein n=1 Tax=Oikopleura dioica TaxID=34765 RepID=E4XCR2_OIKDI|nr:unnamed protein product [Oikopleura dioica]
MINPTMKNLEIDPDVIKMLEICGKEVLRERAMSGRELAGQELIDFIRNLVVNVGKIREARLRCRQLEPELETLSKRLQHSPEGFKTFK